MVQDLPNDDSSAKAMHSAVPRRKKSRLLLRIMLDTNQLFTGSASDLFRAELKELIVQSRSHSDIDIEWLIPEIVRWEREYQMTTAALELLPSLVRLERLLGHKLGINEDIMSSRVRDAIDKQVSELGVKVIPLHIDSVDWKGIVVAAAFRHPPFEKGKKEKGFRDSVIAECFMQVIGDSPKSPSSCRIALVTGDSLLTQAVETRTVGATNVRILRSLDDLQSLINTLVSDVTEEFVARIREAAGAYFFSQESKTGLIYDERLQARISEQFADKLREVPKGATIRENGTWYIEPPSFVEKKGQKVTWRTSIVVEANASKLEARESAFPRLSNQSGLVLGSSLSDQSQMTASGVISLGPTVTQSFGVNPGSITTLGAASGLPGAYSDLYTLTTLPQTEKVLVEKGHTLFHVTWSVTVTSAGKLTHPKIESIEWKETVWGETSKPS